LKDDKMSYLEDLRERGRDANPFFKLMGIEVATFGDGKAELQMEVRPEMLNGAGWMQGGMPPRTAAAAMAIALFTLLDPGEGSATRSETTSYLRGVREGRIAAAGKVVRMGRRVAFAEGRVMADSADGPVLTQTSASFSIIRGR
jgi:uncharacterized protein (TIGR00369 family)